MPLDATHLWPGGIPSTITIQPELELADDEVKEDCKAWLLFLSENWIPLEATGATSNPTDYRVRQRRKLVVQWAKADQSLRDSYHDRAPTPEFVTSYPRDAVFPPSPEDAKVIGSYDVIVLPGVDISSPARYDHWVKILLLFNRFDGAAENFLGDDGTSHPLLIGGDLAPVGQVDLKNAAQWMFLENANFHQFAMTRNGKVLFHDVGYLLVFDQQNIDEGSVSIVDYAMNGQLKNEIRTRPYCFDWLSRELGDCTPLDELESELYDIRENEDLKQLDINASVLDMLQSAKHEDPNNFEDSFEEQVENYAPGLLALEAEGRLAEYDASPLVKLCFSEC